LHGEASECSHGSLYLTFCFYMLKLFVHKSRPNNPRHMTTLGLFNVQAEIAYELLFYVNPVVFQIYFPCFFLVGYRNCLSPGLCTTVYAGGREHHRLNFFIHNLTITIQNQHCFFRRRLSQHYNHNFTSPWAFLLPFQLLFPILLQLIIDNEQEVFMKTLSYSARIRLQN
jgi:hypothetical protein